MASRYHILHWLILLICLVVSGCADEGGPVPSTQPTEPDPGLAEDTTEVAGGAEVDSTAAPLDSGTVLGATKDVVESDASTAKDSSADADTIKFTEDSGSETADDVEVVLGELDAVDPISEDTLSDGNEEDGVQNAGDVDAALVDGSDAAVGDAFADSYGDTASDDGIDSNSGMVDGDTEATDDAALDGNADGVSDAVGFEDAEEIDLSCNPALSLEPSVVYVSPYELVFFTASGGTGDYEFKFLEDDAGIPLNGSGGIVNSVSGAYLSGGLLGATDWIELVDEGCEGAAIAEVIVANPLEVFPSQVTATAGTGFQFIVLGGSGTVTFIGQLMESGGSVTPDGFYVAGLGDGVDLIEVLDPLSGETVEVTVTVAADAPIDVIPKHVGVSVGSTVGFEVSGGSGIVNVVSDDPESVQWDGGRVIGVQPGVFNLTVQDAFTGAETALLATVASPVGGSLERTGEVQLSHSMAGGFDINKDGYGDVVMGLWDQSFNGWRSGAVYVYLGTESGDMELARVLEGQNREDLTGTSIAVGDLDGDGWVDLAVGSPRNDYGLTDNGLIQIYMGEPNSAFSEFPSYVFAGPEGSARLGNSLAMCDFNGDGLMDLGAGARLMERPGDSSVAQNQGAVYVWLGYPDGLLDEPDLVRYGTYLSDSGEWKEDLAVELGWTMSADDVNGDGLCDLVAGGMEYVPEALTTGSDYGFVAVYAGVAPDELTLGGLSELPVRTMAANTLGARGGQFGRFLSTGDVNGDGMAEIVIGQHQRKDLATGNTNNFGAVHVYAGAPFAEEVVRETESDATWSMYGDSSGDRMGHAVDVIPADSKNPGAILVGEPLGEVSGGPNNMGVVHVISVPTFSKDAPPEFQVVESYSGETASSFYGIAVARVRDTNGDGLTDFMVFAGRADDYGFEVGAPFLQTRGPEGTAEILEFPGKAGGYQFGMSGAILSDLDGDGYEDILVGERLFSRQGHGTMTGRAVVLSGATGPYYDEPGAVLEEFVGFSSATLTGSFDQLGYDVSGVGDFDGDGVEDFGVVALNGEHPTNINSNYFEEIGNCGQSLSTVGAVYVFSGAQWDGSNTPPITMGFGAINDTIQTLSNGVDINGDGYDDVVMGSGPGDMSASNTGQIYILYGGEPSANGKVQFNCDSKTVDSFEGATNDYRFGHRIRRLGDLNDDGCEDFVVSGYLANLGLNNQGALHVIYGWGGEGCPAEPMQTVLVSGLANAQAGYGLDAGEDMDGDGIPDIVAGGFNSTVGGVTVGSAWFIPGSYVMTLPLEPLVSFASPSNTYSFIPPGATGTYRLDGAVAGGRFGRSVAFVPEGGPGLSASVAIGSPLGSVGDVPLSGAVFIYGATDLGGEGGFSSEPLTVIGGREDFPNGFFGERLDSALMGGIPTLLVLEQYGTLAGTVDVATDGGAVHVFPLKEAGE